MFKETVKETKNTAVSLKDRAAFQKELRATFGQERLALTKAADLINQHMQIYAKTNKEVPDALRSLMREVVTGQKTIAQLETGKIEGYDKQIKAVEGLQKVITTLNEVASDTKHQKNSVIRFNEGGKLQTRSLTQDLRRDVELKRVEQDRHQELIDTLSKQREESQAWQEKKDKIKDLGTNLLLTTVFGPAAPIIMTLRDVKDAAKESLGIQGSLFEATKNKLNKLIGKQTEANEKLTTVTEQNENEKKDNKKQKGLFEKLLKKVGLMGGAGGGLFGGLLDMIPGGKYLGKGLGKLGSLAKGLGGSLLSKGGSLIGKAVPAVLSGAAGLGKAALPWLSKAAGFAGPAAAVAGAGYTGWQAGGLLNKYAINPLAAKITGDKDATLGTAVFDAVESLKKGFDKVTDKVSAFFDKSFVDMAKDAWKDIGDKAEETWKAAGRGLSYAWNVTKQTGQKGLEAAKQVGQAAVGAGQEVKRRAYGAALGATGIHAGVAAGRWSDEELQSIAKGQGQQVSFRGGTGLTQETKDKITAASQKYGIDPQHMMAIAQMESGGNATAVSHTGAAGLYQFTGGTAKQYGLKNRFDPEQNIDAAARLYADNAKSLKARGIEPTLENVYLAHQQGAGGAAQIIAASEGRGTVSADVARNMGLNVGAGQDAAGFRNTNARHIQAAMAKAEKVTVAADAYSGVPKAGTAQATMTAAAAPTAESYERIAMASKQPIVQMESQNPASTSTSTAASSRTNMDDIPFYVEDVGLLVMNGGYIG
jgi:hypothetical protein